MQASPRRARSEDQKSERKTAILSAAQNHLSEVGVEKFSMASVGKLCGVAKGTLYLYFETREALLLEICITEVDTWYASFGASTDEWQTDERFALAFYQGLTARPLLLQLFSRLDSVIEHNVSLAAFVRAKRHMGAVISNLSQLMATELGLTPAQALDVNRSLGALLMGSVQGDLGPKFEDAVLPDDVRQLMDLFSSEQLFITNACRIIRGIRTETPEGGIHYD